MNERDALAEAIDVVGTFRQDPNDWTKTRPKVPGELAADIIAALPSVGLVLVSKDTLEVVEAAKDLTQNEPRGTLNRYRWNRLLAVVAALSGPTGEQHGS